MEFPIEIQILINDYARPLTRPDWKKGSFINKNYRSWEGQIGRLNIYEFKSYLEQCSDKDNDESYKGWSDDFEKRILDEYDIFHMRMGTFNLV